MRTILNWLLGLLVAFRVLKPRPGERPKPRLVAPAESRPGAELVVVALLVGVALCSVLVMIAYAADWSTQAFGGAIAGALALLALALIVAAKTFVVEEQLVEDYPPDANPEAQDEVARIIKESGDRITRKRLLGGAAGLAGTAMGAALLTPAVSLGPVFDTSQLNEQPWRPGRGIVDERGFPVLADDIEIGPFYTAFPEDADPKAISSPLIIVRLPVGELRLPPGREDWAPEGIVAYSKICTHAGCALALYRNPLFEQTEPERALVCPCHYSTFDPATGGTVLYGPAGRPLPQLPLQIAPDRRLRAGGPMSTPPGPSWWGVRSA